jgi:hypothetical protein
LTTTSGVGDVGRAAGCVVAGSVVAGCVVEVGAPLADFGDFAGVRDAGARVAGFWAAGCSVVVDVLRVVDGRRLVCAIDTDEINRSSIAGNKIGGRRIVENFIRVRLRYVMAGLLEHKQTFGAACESSAKGFGIARLD